MRTGRPRRLSPPGGEAGEESGFASGTEADADVDVVINAIRPSLNALCGGGVRILLNKRCAFADGLLDGGIGDDVSGESDIGFEELAGDGGDAFVDLLGFVAIFDHVDHDADFAGGAAADEDLHDGVGVGDGGGFWGGDDDDVIGGGGEGEDVASDTGTGVDDDGVGGFGDGVEVGDDAFAVGFDEVGHFGEAGGAGDEGKSGGDLCDDFAEGALTGDDVGEVVAGLDVAEDVGVGEAEVCIL